MNALSHVLKTGQRQQTDRIVSLLHLCMFPVRDAKYNIHPGLFCSMQLDASGQFGSCATFSDNKDIKFLHVLLPLILLFVYFASHIVIL